jgi:DNA-directed RNA polymerase specialized sigma24 family protein
MNETELLAHLASFVQSHVAVGLCKRYGTDAAGALGYLWLCLRPKCNPSIRDPWRWVKVNAGFHLRNYLRRECAGLPPTEGTARPHPTAPEVPSQSDLLGRLESAKRLNTALAKLPQRQREAFRAWAGEHPQGFSCRYLATRCGVSVTAVCKWAEKARRQLARELGDLQ